MRWYVPHTILTNDKTVGAFPHHCRERSVDVDQFAQRKWNKYRSRVLRRRRPQNLDF